MRTQLYKILALVSLMTYALHTSGTGLQAIGHLTFKQQPPLDALASNEVQTVHQDRDGFIWIGTRNGLCRYDGYNISTHKSNLYTPDLFTSNNILSIQDDKQSKLWIGTQNGLNVMDLRTAEIKKYTSPALPNNTVSSLLVTRDGHIWIGTEAGLCLYDTPRDSFITYNEQRTRGVFKKAAVKSLCEDSDGDIWIGTWARGLYRYNPTEDKFYAYPPVGKRNSPHTIFEDSKGQIWIGSWGEGIFLLHHPKDMQRVSYLNYKHHSNDGRSLLDNIVYAIGEDRHTHSLWIGTRKGLSIMSYETPGQFIHYTPQDKSHYIPSDEINSITCDNDGTIWMGAIGGGVLTVNTRTPLFHSYDIRQHLKGASVRSVRSLFADADSNLWMGVGTYGLIYKKKGSEQLLQNAQIPGFGELTSIPTVNTIIQRKSGKDLWFGTSNGIYILTPGQKVRKRTDPQNAFLNEALVNTLYEDRAGNCWIGSRTTLCVERTNGQFISFRTLDFDDGSRCSMPNVSDFTEDTDASTLWAATTNHGIIRITRDEDTLHFRHFSTHNRKLLTNTVLCLYLDRHGRLWAGTDGGGLYLYDRGKEQFIAQSLAYHIPGDRVGSIEEDEKGNLWIGTNVGLVKFNINNNKPTVRIYTINDGLLDNFLIPHASCHMGDKLLFGSYKGYNEFRPADIEEVRHEDIPLAITDFKLFNRSFYVYPAEVRKQLSTLTPNFTERMVIPHQYNNFSIEFAALTYRNPDANKYAYRLEGFDTGWQYVDAAHRVAYYNNLKSGTYKFLLKAANENGVWRDTPRELTIVIQPPFWATWWAYLLYALAFIATAGLILRTTRKRMMLRNELHIKELEKAKIEELNHAKLQFFTNITHELLTPLTILSATVDELKLQAPAHSDLYSIMNYNIRRLIRLLQQILEFRKAETGNLKLRVSQGNLAAFVRNEVNSFQPLIKKRKIHLSVTCTPENIIGYFDTDKVDKILYNLISNAAKYNRAEGHICVNLTIADISDRVLLTVKDDGIGISAEKQKNLFKRFYEGDYRRFNTIGTGIGLSLTKDLVELHNGSIQVVSEVGQGTEFRISLPIARNDFHEEQIDDNAPLELKEEPPTEEMDETEDRSQTSDKPAHTLLLVEDNEELLWLMVKLLQREYTIFTACNGKEAIPILEQEDIDLTVSDIMMPEMDGIELCRYIKSHIEISHIPIILLTAKNKDEDRAEAYDVGADAYLTKPFSLPVLHARIRNLIRHKEQQANSFKDQKVLELKGLEYTSLDETFLQQAIDCVQRHLADPDFDQTQFVEEMNTTRSTAFRKLKSLTGLTFPGFLRNIRMKAACRLMEEKKGIRISELAYAVGYSNPRYFNTCFKKETGMLPQEYMERFVQENTH